MPPPNRSASPKSGTTTATSSAAARLFPGAAEEVVQRDVPGEITANGKPCADWNSGQSSLEATAESEGQKGGTGHQREQRSSQSLLTHHYFSFGKRFAISLTRPDIRMDGGSARDNLIRRARARLIFSYVLSPGSPGAPTTTIKRDKSSVTFLLRQHGARRMTVLRRHRPPSPACPAFHLTALTRIQTARKNQAHFPTDQQTQPSPIRHSRPAQSSKPLGKPRFIPDQQYPITAPAGQGTQTPATCFKLSDLGSSSRSHPPAGWLQEAYPSGLPCSATAPIPAKPATQSGTVADGQPIVKTIKT